MRNAWFVVDYTYKCKDGTELICAGTRAFETYCEDIAGAVRADNSITKLVPCATMKDAESVARTWNKWYEQDGKLATTENMKLHGGV